MGIPAVQKNTHKSHKVVIRLSSTRFQMILERQKLLWDHFKMSSFNDDLHQIRGATFASDAISCLKVYVERHCHIFHNSLTTLNLLFLALIIRNVSWAPNQHIKMISEGSCDTENWSKGFWNVSFDITGLNYILKYIEFVLNCNNLSKYYNILLEKILSHFILNIFLIVTSSVKIKEC